MGADPHNPDVPLRHNLESKLRLAIVAPGEIFGGAERQILTLLPRLVSGGIPAPVLILFNDRELADQARQLGISVRVLPARRLFDLRLILSLRDILHEEKINAVSLQGYRALVYFSLAVSRNSIGVVKTVHGKPEVIGDTHIQRLRLRIYHWMQNAATRWLGAHVVYVTQDLQGRCNSEHKILNQSVIYNGIAPLDRASTVYPPEFQSDAINLAAVGRLEPVKGLDAAIRAMMHPAMPSHARLFLIGSGPEQQKLTNLARSLGATERVFILGFRENIYDYIAHADALLIPSHHEGLPYTLLEALSLGTPVIASQVGGLAEVLTDRQTALLVEPGNPPVLANAMRLLARTPELREQLVQNGIELIAARFTATEMASRYRSLFEAIRRTHD